jgi:DNA (cytosine-5)-methyltransferase 1
MNHGSLFSGIGGFDLAAEWMGWNNTFHCEWMPFPRKVLSHYFPNSISYEDITKTDFSIHGGTIDILTGGFPCQPYSSAGKRLGKEDERHLWPHMLRAISEINPTYVVGENVRGLTNWNGGMVFEEVCVDLESEGYTVQPILLPACAVGAPHRRDRVWFVASNTNLFRQHECECNNEEQSSQRGINAFDDINENVGSGNVTNTKCERLCWMHKAREKNIFNRENTKIWRGSSRHNKKNDWNNFPTQPPICGGDDGLPTELDGITFSKWRQESIKGYGNAIVPQVAYEIFKVIQRLNDTVQTDIPTASN